MASHMQIKDLMGLKIGGEEAITFHANSRQKSDSPAIEDEAGNAVAEIDEGNAKVADAGIIVVGKPPKARALMNFGGVAAGQSPYAKTLNRFAAELPSVNVYACIIPTAIAYYCPQKIRNPKHDQKAVINHIYSQLNPKVHKVDIFTALDNHKGEEIYLRTDHHWSPLGGYYAAKELARAAKVNFPILKSYDKRLPTAWSAPCMDIPRI